MVLLVRRFHHDVIEHLLKDLLYPYLQPIGLLVCFIVIIRDDYHIPVSATMLMEVVHIRPMRCGRAWKRNAIETMTESRHGMIGGSEELDICCVARLPVHRVLCMRFPVTCGDFRESQGMLQVVQAAHPVSLSDEVRGEGLGVGDL